MRDFAKRTPLHRGGGGGAGLRRPVPLAATGPIRRRDLLPETADRGLEHLGPGVVEHDLVGPLALLIERELGPLAVLQGRLGPAARPSATRASLCSRGASMKMTRSQSESHSASSKIAASSTTPRAFPRRTVRAIARSNVRRMIGWRIVSRSHRAEGWAKTISPRARRSMCGGSSGSVDGASTPVPNRSTTRSRTGLWSSRAWPTASASSTKAPRRASAAAARLLPPPIPPIRPMTGIAPCFQGPGRPPRSRLKWVRVRGAMTLVFTPGALRPRAFRGGGMITRRRVRERIVIRGGVLAPFPAIDRAAITN